ncbi:MAG TPA: RNA polymerase sigma factor [Mucilaginibacter sp.]|nr:RNA polymerase sigma factor [Mucilaginibacter sp.]
MGKEEAELIARCKKGDIKGYELLYNRYSAAMYHTCLRIVIYTADAEDILQDAFMEAFTSLDKIKNADAFGGWLKRIVINKSINQVKRHRKSWLELEETDLADQPDEQKIDELDFKNKLDAIVETLSALPEKYRVVINLHIFEAMSFEDIAGMMNVPSATIRSQYLRAKQKILDGIRVKIE